MRTRTEERLAEALAARAAAVREHSLRPLMANESGRQAGLTSRALVDAKLVWPTQTKQRWRWLVPVCAATAVAAVIGLVFGLAHIVRTQFGAPFANVSTVNAPPPYYVYLDENLVLTVRATGTGRITDTLDAPERWTGGGMRLITGVAAAANGRTFVAVYNLFRAPYRTGVYTFSLRADGSIADFALVKHGVLPGLADISVALSPDGSKVAIAGVSPEAAAAGAQPLSDLKPARIVVLNLRTGRREIWQGGMRRPGRQLGINSVSWANNGRSLVFLAQWCQYLAIGDTAACGGRWAPVTDVREIPATGHGGLLSGGRTLLRGSPRSPAILQAIASPDGRSVLAMTQRGHEVTVSRFAMSTGRQVEVLYRRRADSPLEAFIASDGSGQYLIFNENVGAVDGWINRGRFHSMKTGGLQVWSSAW